MICTETAESPDNLRINSQKEPEIFTLFLTAYVKIKHR